MSFDRAIWLDEAQALAARLRAMAAAEFARWNQPPARPDGALVMPFPAYDPVERDYWRLLGEAGIGAIPADYRRWWDAHGFSDDDHAWIAGASLADLDMAALRIQRAERFCDGFIASAFASGALTAILDRLIALSADLPHAPATSPWRQSSPASAR